MKPSYGILNSKIMSSHIQNNHIIYFMSSILKTQHNSEHNSKNAMTRVFRARVLVLF